MTQQKPVQNATVPDIQAIQDFFEGLYADVEDGFLVLSHPSPAHRTPQGKPALESDWFNLASASWDSIALAAAQRAQTATVYYGVAIQRPTCDPKSWERGKSATAYVVPGLWLDLDLAYGQHAASTLPATDAEALDFLLTLQDPPSLIIHSGGGLYGHWLFKEPYRIATQADHDAITCLSKQFTYTLVQAGKLHGWTLDALGDLARVLRPPGTINHKYGKLVTVLHETGLRYNPEAFDWLLDLPAPARVQHAGQVIPGQPDLLAVAEHYGCRLDQKSQRELAGAHPAHGSSTGDNFNLNLAKGLWHCWRHGTGGDALSLIAVCEGLVACEDMRSGALRGEAFVKVVNLANAQFQAGIVLENKTPPPDDETPADAERPTIQISTTVCRVVDAATAALQALPQAPALYQRARRLCVIARHGRAPQWLRRQTDTPLIQEASPALLWELLTTAAHWVKWDERLKGDDTGDKWKTVTPPKWVVEVLQGRAQWPFPMLEGIVGSPTLRPDGSLLTTQGYDPATGLYLDWNGTTFPALPHDPGLDDARSALGRLQEVFQDFPFAERTAGALTNPYFSAAIAAVLTLVGRSAIHGNIPLFGITATAAGSGKGKLADAIAQIGTGRCAPKMGQTLDDNEELKRLLALALEGVSVCCIDNVTHPLGNQFLDMALTAQTITGRILGQNVTAEAPWNAVMFATGNNLSYRGDMARRVVPIALDPRMERPEERNNFRHPDLEAWVRTERPTLVVAALTILRAFFVAGCPSQGLTPYGSFEAWSDLVRNAVVWLGEADPCEGRQDLAAQTDEAYERLATLLTAWEDCYPAKVDSTIPTRTVNQVKQDIALFAANKDAIPNTWDMLREALMPLDKRSDGKTLNTTALGNAFRTMEGRVIGQKRLHRAGEYRHNLLWRVETV